MTFSGARADLSPSSTCLVCARSSSSFSPNRFDRTGGHTCEREEKGSLVCEDAIHYSVFGFRGRRTENKGNSSPGFYSLIMKLWIALLLAAFAAAASAQACSCATSKWVVCDGTPCMCTILVGPNDKRTVDCTKLIPKCFLMKAEMYKKSKGENTRTIGGKPVETAFVDNDGIYDPVCENNGKFKAKQCNNTEECWCVNSAGVRRTDKGDKNLVCEKVVETFWVRIELNHNKTTTPVDSTNLKAELAKAMKDRYPNFDSALVEKVEYDANARKIVVDVKKEKGERATDLASMAYYMEKDVKVLPLFKNENNKFEPVVAGQKLPLNNILVYYVDEEAPTFTMKNLTGGIIAVIVVVVLAVVAGLLILFFLKRREHQYKATQQREMDPM